MFGSGLRRTKTESSIDAIARDLASGMSRREAIQKGAAALLGGLLITPGAPWSRLTRRCPHHRVSCAGRCCPRGEVCLPPRHKHGKHRCGCPRSTTRCNGRCVHLQTDVRNCGRCRHACRKGEHCVHGRCVCPAGATVCAGACVTLAHDPHNCGACGHACGPDQVCASGRCTNGCPNGQTNCSRACVDTQTDPSNCGACGHACANGQACISGTCACPPGNRVCGGICVDTQTDPSNCGACGHACPPDKPTCSAGQCMAGVPT